MKTVSVCLIINLFDAFKFFLVFQKCLHPSWAETSAHEDYIGYEQSCYTEGNVYEGIAVRVTQSEKLLRCKKEHTGDWGDTIWHVSLLQRGHD